MISKKLLENSLRLYLLEKLNTSKISPDRKNKASLFVVQMPYKRLLETTFNINKEILELDNIVETLLEEIIENAPIQVPQEQRDIPDETMHLQQPNLSVDQQGMTDPMDINQLSPDSISQGRDNEVTADLPPGIKRDPITGRVMRDPEAPSIMKQQLVDTKDDIKQRTDIERDATEDILDLDKEVKPKVKDDKSLNSEPESKEEKKKRFIESINKDMIKPLFEIASIYRYQNYLKKKSNSCRNLTEEGKKNCLDKIKFYAIVSEIHSLKNIRKKYKTEAFDFQINILQNKLKKLKEKESLSLDSFDLGENAATALQPVENLPKKTKFVKDELKEYRDSDTDYNGKTYFIAQADMENIEEDDNE